MNNNLKLNIKRLVLFPVYFLFFLFILFTLVIQLISVLFLNIVLAFKDTFTIIFFETRNTMGYHSIFELLFLSVKTWWNQPQIRFNAIRQRREKRRLLKEKYNKLKDTTNETH